MTVSTAWNESAGGVCTIAGARTERRVSHGMCGLGTLFNRQEKTMAQTTIYDLLTATLQNMPRPASTNEIYMRLVKQKAYAHMLPNAARRLISSRLCYMRDHKNQLVSHTGDDGRMVWDFKLPTHGVTAKPEKKTVDIVTQSTTKKPPDNTYVLHVLFSDISAAFAKAAHGLISNDK